MPRDWVIDVNNAIGENSIASNNEADKANKSNKANKANKANIIY